MGVNLRPLLQDLKEEIPLDALSNKIVAIDAFNTLYQFLAAIRQYDGSLLMDSQGRVTSHLSGLFYRSINLLEHGIKLVYVFDGEKPKFKQSEIERRAELREEAERKWKELLEKGEIEEAKKYAQAANFLSEDMVKEAKELINAMGMAYVDAPSEGEAEAAYLAKTGKVYAAGSQDYDALMFGSPLLIRNLSITGKRKIPGSHQYKEILPEKIELNEILKRYNISYEQFVCLGIIVGTDYNPKGIEGYGPKKALELVKTYKTPEKISKAIADKWTYDVSFEEIFDFFIHPPVKDVEISFGAIDEQKIYEILVEQHDFSKERVAHGIERLKKSRSKTLQRTLF